MRHKKRIDIVYILGTESIWNNREILYSLRSVERFVKDHGKIFIVGHKPHFLNDEIIHIPFDDIFHNKARNIKAKIRRAAGDHRLSNDFMFLNDDYFFLKSIESPGDYPFYYKTMLADSERINRHNVDYLPHIIETRLALRAKGLPEKNFDTHFPIIYNKKKVCEVCEQFNWNVHYGLIFKSVYCNTLGIEGILREDCKINHPHISYNWPVITTGLECFSIGDRSINKNLEQFLFGLFPKPSRYERTQQAYELAPRHNL